MDRLIFVAIAVLTLGFLIKFVLGIRADNALRHRQAQYEQWLREITEQGPEAVKAALPVIRSVLADPYHDFRGPWEATKIPKDPK